MAAVTIWTSIFASPRLSFPIGESCSPHGWVLDEDKPCRRLVWGPRRQKLWGYRTVGASRAGTGRVRGYGDIVSVWKEKVLWRDSSNSSPALMALTY